MQLLRMWLQPDRMSDLSLFLEGSAGRDLTLAWHPRDVLLCFSLLGSSVKEDIPGTYQLPTGQLWKRKSGLPLESQSRIPDILFLKSDLRLSKSLS